MREALFFLFYIFFLLSISSVIVDTFFPICVYDYYPNQPNWIELIKFKRELWYKCELKYEDFVRERVNHENFIENINFSWSYNYTNATKMPQKANIKE